MQPPSLRTLLLLVLFLLGRVVAAQTGNVQTVRGTIVDLDSRQPLFGAAVVVLGSDPPLSATTDEEGRFTIAKVPTGRIDLRIRAMGYEEQLMPNLLVTSAKELVLNVQLQSSVQEIQEVTVSGAKPKGEARNDMATLSSHTISVEETARIAGGINDPARMAGSFAGVANDPSGNNTIVARGNSPKGVLWRLEGVEIPNPNHFTDEGSTGGPINVLNSDMLDNSEFYTGAFAPEYGNVTSAVFDMHLRDGNDKKREYTLKVGVLGTDLTAEGPMPGVAGGSYLANFRYSTLALLDGAGVVDYGGVPKYTDASFKLKLPTAKAGTFSLFGLGGISNIHQEEDGVTGDTLFSRVDYGSRMAVLGLTHTRTLGENSYVQSIVSLSGSGTTVDYDEAPVPGESTRLERRQTAELNKWTTRFSTTLNNKLSAKHKLRSGIIVSTDHFRMGSIGWHEDVDQLLTDLDARGAATTVQAFTSWKWRWNERWTMTSGVHVLHFGVNDATSVEPRLAFRYQMRPRQAVTLGAGLHSRIDGVSTYQFQQVDSEGRATRPNRSLGPTKAAHVVLGYEQMLAEDIQLKVEAYYQHLYDVPVEKDPSSTFSLVNSVEWFPTKWLVNDGVGRNMGVEASVEKFFTRGYHFKFTGSISDAQYKPLDGKWYSTRFNMGTVANVLAGKEWKVGKAGKDRVLTAGFRYSLIGGMHRTPIDLEASIAAREEKNTGEAWSIKGDDIHKLDIVLSYRIGRPKVSHEFKLDIQNVLNAQTAVSRYFDKNTNTIKDQAQLALLPVMQYTLRF